MRRLAISLDPLAALREVAGSAAADPAACATLAELAGADAVRVGASEEALPAREPELRHLRRSVSVLELRFAPGPGLLKLALEVQPDRVVLASDVARRRAAEAPLDFRAWGSALAPAVRMLREAGIAVAALIAPELEAVKAAHAADLEAVDLHTAPIVDLPGAERRASLERLGAVARLAEKLRLAVGLSGGLDFRNLELALEAAPGADRVCVGRAFARRALLVGVERSVRDLRARI